jgi:hypothetical protein
MENSSDYKMDIVRLPHDSTWFLKSGLESFFGRSDCGERSEPHRSRSCLTGSDKSKPRLVRFARLCVRTGTLRVVVNMEKIRTMVSSGIRHRTYAAKDFGRGIEARTLLGQRNWRRADIGSILSVASGHVNDRGESESE